MASILVVDDSRSIREIVSRALTSQGYRVYTAENGKKGVEVAAGNDLDLILSDLNMPVMDGLGLIRGVRKLPRHKKTPILMVTTESQLKVKNEAKAAGATGWIVKPIRPNRLIEVVKQVLAKTKGVGSGI